MPQNLSIEQSISIIIASIGSIEIGIALKHLKSIINPKEFKLDPIIETNDGKFLIFNDNTFPVIDFHKSFQLKMDYSSEFLRLLLLEYNNVQFAFFVEEIKEVVILKEIMFDPKYDQAIFDTSHIQSIIKFEERSLLLPNFDKIIQTISNKVT